jgi:Zn-dependent peptidase ImmA (M78 family)
MSKFKPSKDKLNYISNNLDVKEDLTNILLNSFVQFYNENVRKQHLASVMRGLELYIRRATGQNDFKIVWSEVDSKFGVGLYYKDRTMSKYAIAVPKELTDKEARLFVAHELGHLFCAKFFTTYDGGKLVMNKSLMHKMANVFAVFTLMERTDFYNEKAPKMLYGDYEEIIKSIMSMERGGILP